MLKYLVKVTLTMPKDGDWFNELGARIRRPRAVASVTSFPFIPVCPGIHMMSISAGAFYEEFGE